MQTKCVLRELLETTAALRGDGRVCSRYMARVKALCEEQPGLRRAGM